MRERNAMANIYRTRVAAIAGVLGVLALLTSALRVCGQPAGVMPVPAPPPKVSINGDSDTAGLLDPEYRNDKAGLRICPPAGSRLVERSGGELLSFVNDQKQWAGSVVLVFLKTPVKLEDYLKTNADAMNTTFKGVSVEKSAVEHIGGKQAGRQITAFIVQQEIIKGHPEQVPFMKFDVMIPMPNDQATANEFVHLTMFAPLKDRDLATRTYEAMLKTFVIVDAKQAKAQMQKNLMDGQTWLRGISADMLAGKLIRDPQFLRIVVQDKEVGYVRFDEGEDVRQTLRGADVKVRSYTIIKGTAGKDDTILTSTTDAWWAYMMKDGQPNVEALGKSSWDVLVRCFPPADADNSEWVWQQEKGTTKFDAEAMGQAPGEEGMVRPALLLSVHTEEGKDKDMSLARALPDNHQWLMDDRYPRPLPKALEFLWPRLVDLTKPGSMSFPVFNGTTKRMGMRTISVIGEETLGIDGKTVKAIHLADELENGATNMWTDKDGRILMMRTSDGAMLLPTTQREMDGRFGAKLQQRIGKLPQ